MRRVTARELLHWIEAEGGTFSVEEVGDILGRTASAVEGRRGRGVLLAYQATRRWWRYPVWQFGGPGLHPGLVECLRLLEGHNPAAIVALFLLPHDNEPRLVDLLRIGAVAEACARTQRYVEGEPIQIVGIESVHPRRRTHASPFLLDPSLLMG